MSQSYRLKISRPSLKLRVSTRIPAQFNDGAGISIAKANGVYTVNLDYDNIGTITSYQDLLEATTYIPSWESVGDTFSKISITNFKADLTASFNSQYQPLDAELTAIAGLASAANKLPYFTGSGTAALGDFTAFGRSLVDDADATAARSTLGLVIGTDVQAFDGDLAALAALASTGIARRTGTSTWSVGTAVSNAELATMAAYTFKGNATGSAAVPTDVDIAALTTKASPAAGDYVMLSDQAASGAWKKAAVSSLASAGSVSDIAGNTGAFTLGVGLTNLVNDLRVSLSTFTNTLGADVNLNNIVTWFTGPTVAQGTSGTWLATGTVTVNDTSGSAQIRCRLWDGATIIASGVVTTQGAGAIGVISLSGYITSPAGDIRMDCIDVTSTSGKILFNQSGMSKDSTVSAIRIA